MSTASAEIVSPVPADADGLANVLSFIQGRTVRHGTSPDPAFFLSGAGEHDRVELTEQLYEVLKRVAHALSHGQSISILTRDQEISPSSRRDPRPGAAPRWFASSRTANCTPTCPAQSGASCGSPMSRLPPGASRPA